jgi:hypothetical protein
VEGELVANPYFSDEDYEHWEFSGTWRPDAGQARVVFELNEHNVGFPSAVGQGVQFVLEAESEQAEAYLTGVTFGRPYLAVYNEGAISSNADYKLFFELDIVTAAGTYRGKSQLIAKPWTLPVGELPVKFKWVYDGGFLGAPTDHSDGGILIDSIKSTTYKAVMQVDQALSPGSDTVFVTLDNLSATYEAVIK